MSGVLSFPAELEVPLEGSALDGPTPHPSQSPGAQGTRRPECFSRLMDVDAAKFPLSTGSSIKPCIGPSYRMETRGLREELACLRKEIGFYSWQR